MLESEKVLLDMISGEYGAHLSRQQRLNAVAAIGQMQAAEADDKLAEIASSSELEPEIRDRALETLAGRGGALVRWLAAGQDGDVVRWRRLAGLTCRGIDFDLAGVGWLHRLRLALPGLNQAGADSQPDLWASCVQGAFGLVLALAMLIPFGLDSLELRTLGSIALPALLVAALHVWLLGKIARPVASSPDRWVFVWPEALVVLIVATLIAIVTAVGVLSLGDPSAMLAGNVLIACLVHGVLIGLVRLVCLVSYGWIRVAGRQLIGLAIGALAGLAGIILGMVQAIVVGDQALQNELFSFTFLLAAALPAAGYFFARLDSSVEDQAAPNRPITRTVLALPAIALPVLAGWVYLGAIQSPTSVDRDHVDLEGQPLVVLVDYGRPLSIKSRWNQEVEIEATSGLDDIVLRVDEGEPIDGGYGIETSRLNVRTQGSHQVVVERYGGYAEADQRFGWSSAGWLNLRETTGRALLGSFTKMFGLESLAGQEPTLEFEPEQIPQGSARLELRPEITSNEIAAIEAFERWKKDRLDSQSEDDDSQKGGFGIAIEAVKRDPAADAVAKGTAGTGETSAEGRATWRLAIGSIVTRDPKSGALSLLAGRARDLPDSVPDDDQLVQRVDWLGDDPENHELLKQAMAAAKWLGTEEDGEFIAENWVEIRADGYPNQAELIRLGGPPTKPGDLAVDLRFGWGTRGGLFEVLSIGDGAADVRLLDGWLRSDEEAADCYRIDINALLHGPEFDRAMYASAIGEMRAQMPDPDAMRAVSVDPDEEVSSDVGGGNQCQPWLSVPDLNQVVAAKGSYVEDFGIEWSDSEPDVFRHYFVVVGEAGTYAPGTIIRGEMWDQTDVPRYEVVHGFDSDCTPCFTNGSELTYLGPTLEPELRMLPEAFERERGPFEQAFGTWIGEGEPPASVGMIEPAAPPEASEAWTPYAAAMGQWIDEFGVDLYDTNPPAVFEEYFVVVGEEGIHGGSVPPGTILRGSNWDSDGNPGFTVVYGWNSAGEPFSWVSATQIVHLGSELKPGWLALPVLARDYARQFDFRDWQTQFVQSICEGAVVDGCSEAP